jgi:hypothetical protein
MVTIVFWAALIAAILCFLIFLVSAWMTLFGKTGEKDAVKAAAATATSRLSVPGAPSVSDLTQLLQALAAAIQAITQAGPSLSSLAASIVFLGIAAWTAGAGSTPKLDCSIAKGTELTDSAGKAVDDIAVDCETQSSSE